ncbi:MAG: hypothetical protein ABIH46_06500 [Chloroflexota bacterium]
MSADFSEEGFVLYPAVYNKRGVEGDFEVYVREDVFIMPLSGRRGPYTSVREWFEGVGESLIGDDPEYVLLVLSHEDASQVYRLERPGAGAEDLSDKVQPVTGLYVTTHL